MKTTENYKGLGLIDNPHTIEQIETAQKAAQYIVRFSKKDYLALRSKLARNVMWFFIKMQFFLSLAYWFISILWYYDGRYIDELNAISFKILKSSPIALVKFENAWNFQFLLSICCQCVFIISCLFYGKTKIIMRNREIISYTWYMNVYLFIIRMVMLFAVYILFIFAGLMAAAKAKGISSACLSGIKTCFLHTADMFYYATFYSYLLTSIPILLLCMSLAGYDPRQDARNIHDIIDWKVVRKYTKNKA